MLCLLLLSFGCGFGVLFACLRWVVPVFRFVAYIDVYLDLVALLCGNFGCGFDCLIWFVVWVVNTVCLSCVCACFLFWLGFRVLF